MQPSTMLLRDQVGFCALTFQVSSERAEIFDYLFRASKLLLKVLPLVNQVSERGRREREGERECVGERERESLQPE
jgi:hypothetical protein